MTNIPVKYYVIGSGLQHTLFDTTSKNGCLHGAPPHDDKTRKERSLFLIQYFTERAMDEDQQAPLGFTNLQFMERFERQIDETMSQILLADAANAILDRDNYGNARMLIRMVMHFDAFRLNDGFDLVNISGVRKKESEYAKTMTTPPWMMEMSHAMARVERPKDVFKYIAERIPCDCLASKKQEAKDLSKGDVLECWYCRKKGTKKEIRFCSKCHEAQYCSRECQVADWPEHKALCLLARGKQIGHGISKETLDKSLDCFMKRHGIKERFSSDSKEKSKESK